MKSGHDFRAGGRYAAHPQAWIDYVIKTDFALSNVRLSYPPRYSGSLTSFGSATLENRWLQGKTTIGRPSLASRRELLDTIIHEEVHHRLWRRAQNGNQKAWERIADLEAEEAFVELVTYRFFRLQHYLKSIGRK